MNINLKKYQSSLLFLPLGGSGEIGMNLNLYQLDGKWIMLDCGIGFADDWLPGADMVVPNIEFIQQIKKDLLAIIITHAHEDHLGAVQYLWDELGCPIYTTDFTATFLEIKLRDAGYQQNEIPINRIKSGSNFSVGPFDIEFVEITHSVPEMNGALIRTKHGNILHTGDWKLDPTPLVGNPSDLNKLKKFGDEGVLAMVSDSTNIFSPGHSGSEGKLAKSLEELVANCSNLVVVTTFASNVARMHSIAMAGIKSGRSVVLAGRSLYRMKQAAQNSNYLSDINFISLEEARRIDRNKLLVICTGCQGEALAATNKLATDNHPQIKLKADDTIIFSSKIIPGNDKKIYRLFNKFAEKSINVITEQDHFVHVSGHPNVEDVKEMYEMIRPQISVPVHGETVHIHEHARLALKWGIPQALKVANGDIIELSHDEGGKVIGQATAGYLALDGNCLLSPDSDVMKMRRRVRDNGVVIVTLFLDDKRNLLAEPIINGPAILDDKIDADVIQELKRDIAKLIKKPNKKKHKSDSVENIVRSVIRQYVKNELGKNPPIIVNIARDFVG